MTSRKWRSRHTTMSTGCVYGLRGPALLHLLVDFSTWIMEPSLFPARTETEWQRQTPVSAPTEAVAADGADRSDSSESCSDEENGHARGAHESEREASSDHVVRGTQESERPTSSRKVGSVGAGQTATAWVGVMHGVVVGALEFVLTLTNAVDQNALGSRSGVRDVIFGGSTVMEAVGLLFALVATFQNCTRLEAPVGVGVPAVAVVEGLLFLMEAGGGVVLSAVVGVLLQTLSFLTYVIAVQVTDKVGRIVLIICVVIVAPFCSLVALGSADALRKCSGSECWAVERIILVCIALFWFTVPFIVEVWESILLLFTSGSASLSLYTLAVLDLVIIAPATCFVPMLGMVIGFDITAEDT